MPVSAISPGLFPTALALDTATAPDARAPDARLPDARLSDTRPPDTVVFSSGPFRLLADLAATGLRQLATLLSAVEAQAGHDDPVPLGHLAKAAGAAARQVADGYGALLAQGPDRVLAALPSTAPPPRTAPATSPPLRALARSVGMMPAPLPASLSDRSGPPRVNAGLRAVSRWLGAAPSPDADPAATDPDPAGRWLSEAKYLLRRTGEALDAAAEALPAPEPRPTFGPAAPPPIDWAFMEVTVARGEIAAALARLAAHPNPVRPMPMRGTVAALVLPRLPEAAGLLGFVLLLGVAGLASGTWTLSAAAAGLAGTGLLAWRLCRAAEGVRLDGRA